MEARTDTAARKMACSWRDNPFAHHLLSQLLGSAFLGQDERDAGEALQRWHDHDDQLGQAARELLAQERLHQQRASSGAPHGDGDAGDGDDLFAFVSMDGEEPSASAEPKHAEEESLAWIDELDLSFLPHDVRSFLAAQGPYQDVLFSARSSSSTSIQDARRALWHDVAKLHQEATKEALDTLFQFIHTLSNYLAKEAPSRSQLHPAQFKRALLTGLAPPRSDAGEAEPSAVNCAGFAALFQLAFSFSDETRIRTVELFLMLSRVPADYSLPAAKCLVERPSALFTKTAALAIYDSAYAVDRWAPALGHHTFRTKTFPMKIREAEALVHHYQALHLGTQLLSEHRRVLDELEAKLQTIIDSEFGGRAFVKISTRSPKDVVFHLPKFEPTLRQVTEDWKSRYGLPDPMPDSVHQALMQRCGALCMSVSSGAEAVEMLKSSKRIWVDLKEALETPANDFTIKFVVRQWMDIPNAFELRGFVRNRRLVALTQYFSMCYFPWITMDDWRDAKDRVMSFFETTIAALLPVDDCVCDFVVCEDRVMVIELNLYGRTAGAALFSWDTDQQLLYGNRPFEFRVVADDSLRPTAM